MIVVASKKPFVDSSHLRNISNISFSLSPRESFSQESIPFGSRFFSFLIKKAQGFLEPLGDFFFYSLSKIKLKSPRTKNTSIEKVLVEKTSFQEKVFVHPSAFVHPSVQLGKGVHIDAYSVLGENVVVGDYTHIKNHVVIHGETKIGHHCLISPFVVLGHEPQHLLHQGKTFPVIIGNHVHIREHCTLHQGTHRSTKVGDHCLLMVGCHLGHDCQLGRHVVLSNQVGLAGHVKIDDHGVVGGMTGVHQWVHIGKGAMIGGFSALTQDVAPYGIAIGNRAVLESVNIHRLKRLGFSGKIIQEFYKFYQEIFFKTEGSLKERLKILEKDPVLLRNPCIQDVYDFLMIPHKRSLTLGSKKTSL